MTDNYLVIGLGRFGAHVASELYNQGAHVLAIDNDPGAVEQAKDKATRAIVCNADDFEVMQSIGAYDADIAIVAIARAFDVTVLVTHSLIQHGMKRVLVRVESEHQAQAVRALGATEVVFPEKDIAKSVARRLMFPSLAEEIPLGDNFAVMEVPCPDEFVGKTLQEIHLRKKFNVNLIAVKKEAGDDSGLQTVTMSPAPDEPLPPDCHLLLIGSLRKLDWLRKKFKLPLHVRDQEDLVE